MLLENKNLFDKKYFFFTDFSLTIDIAYTKELFRRMRGLKKKFISGGNVDVLAEDEDLLRVSHKAGCIEWISGLKRFPKSSLNGAT